MHATQTAPVLEYCRTTPDFFSFKFGPLAVAWFSVNQRQISLQQTSLWTRLADLAHPVNEYADEFQTGFEGKILFFI